MDGWMDGRGAWSDSHPSPSQLLSRLRMETGLPAFVT